MMIIILLFMIVYYSNVCIKIYFFKLFDEN